MIVVREIGISTQLIQDFNSNEKHSKFPDYAKDYIKEYIFLLGIDGAFSSIYNYIVYYGIEKGILNLIPLFHLLNFCISTKSAAQISSIPFVTTDLF